MNDPDRLDRIRRALDTLDVDPNETRADAAQILEKKRPGRRFVTGSLAFATVIAAVLFFALRAPPPVGPDEADYADMLLVVDDGHDSLVLMISGGVP